MGSQVKETKKRQKRASWTIAEEQTLYSIVSNDISSLNSKFIRKSKKIFVKMAKRIRSKSPQQCRNHFKNILIKFRSVQQYLQHMETEFQKRSRAKSNQADPIELNELQPANQDYDLEYRESGSFDKNKELDVEKYMLLIQPNSLDSLLDLNQIAYREEIELEPEICQFQIIQWGKPLDDSILY